MSITSFMSMINARPLSSDFRRAQIVLSFVIPVPTIRPSKTTRHWVDVLPREILNIFCVQGRSVLGFCWRFPSRSKLIKHVRELCWLEARPQSSRPSIYLADLCQGTTLSQCPVSASRTTELSLRASHCTTLSNSCALLQPQSIPSVFLAFVKYGRYLSRDRYFRRSRISSSFPRTHNSAYPPDRS